MIKAFRLNFGTLFVVYSASIIKSHRSPYQGEMAAVRQSEGIGVISTQCFDDRFQIRFIIIGTNPSVSYADSSLEKGA